MECEICHKHKATIHYKQVVDGNVREMYVCEGCAKESGFDVSPAACLTDFLFGLNPKDAAPASKDDRSCPGCHMRRSDFRKTSRLGCATCYQTFAEDLAPMIDDMHRGSRHAATVPARRVAEVRAVSLREALERAVASQNFEEAARLRDELKGLLPAPDRSRHAPGEVRS